MAYPFTFKETILKKGVKIQTTSDKTGNIAKYNSDGTRYNIIDVEVPKGIYFADKVMTEKFVKKADGSLGSTTGEKHIKYIVQIPTEIAFNTTELRGTAVDSSIAIELPTAVGTDIVESPDIIPMSSNSDIDTSKTTTSTPPEKVENTSQTKSSSTIGKPIFIIGIPILIIITILVLRK